MIDMSYFGVSGPAQDGGFIAGIGAGAQRLNNARAARANYSKTLAGRVSRSLGNTSTITFNPVREEETLDDFLADYRVFIKFTRVRFLRKMAALGKPYNEFYVSINDISAIQVQQVIDDYMTDNYSRVKAENPGQSDDNIEIYLKEAAKRYWKPTYIGLFERAGYDKDDATSLAQSAVNLHKDGVWGRMPIKAKEAYYSQVYDPSEKEATAEYVVNQGRPQNTTQYAVYGVGLVAIVLLYRSRKKFRGTKARQGAFYGVFS